MKFFISIQQAAWVWTTRNQGRSSGFQLCTAGVFLENPSHIQKQTGGKVSTLSGTSRLSGTEPCTTIVVLCAARLRINCSDVAFQFVLARILSLQTIPNALQHWFGPSFPLVLLMANWRSKVNQTSFPRRQLLYSYLVNELCDSELQIKRVQFLGKEKDNMIGNSSEVFHLTTPPPSTSSSTPVNWNNALYLPSWQMFPLLLGSLWRLGCHHYQQIFRQ